MRPKTHGMTKTPEYRSWVHLKTRCKNKNYICYQDYGGRGISYDPRWENFENFYADMGKKPSRDYSLDRIDNDKGYSKENCRWATIKEQQNNTRANLEINNQGSSKYKGVHWCKTIQFWVARITINGIRKNVGRYATEEEAYQAIQQIKES